jgi:hypothetical protein
MSGSSFLHAAPLLLVQEPPACDELVVAVGRAGEQSEGVEAGQVLIQVLSVIDEERLRRDRLLAAGAQQLARGSLQLQRWTRMSGVVLRRGSCR